MRATLAGTERQLSDSLIVHGERERIAACGSRYDPELKVTEPVLVLRQGRINGKSSAQVYDRRRIIGTREAEYERV